MTVVILSSMPTNDYDKRMASLEKRILNADMSEANREIIWEFKRDLEVQDYSIGRIYKLLNYLKIIAEHIEFNFKEAAIDDIKNTVAWLNKRDVADATKVDTKTILKQFYKWLNNGEYPDTVKWIKTTRKRSNRILPKNILTEEDIQKLLNTAKNTRDKAIIAILWETGARIGELIDLKIGDLEDHKHGKKITIKGKTGPRRIPLISSIPHLQAWINNHPQGKDDEAPLWVNIGTRNHGNKMEYRAIRKTLSKIIDRTELKKPSNPHHFRHSRATYLANRFTESQLCEWFGWIQGSNMPGKYVHLSGRDIDATYSRLHGIEDDSKPEKSIMIPINCPRCETKNDPKAWCCQRCGQALSKKAFEEVEKKEKLARKLSAGNFKAKANSLDEIISLLVEKKLQEILTT